MLRGGDMVVIQEVGKFIGNSVKLEYKSSKEIMHRVTDVTTGDEVERQDAYAMFEVPMSRPCTRPCPATVRAFSLA